MKVGTIFESSHIPLRIGLQAIFFVAASKKASARTSFHRPLGITLKLAWFLGHRIREAMKDDSGLLGGGGTMVEADEVYLGPKPRRARENPGGQSVVSLVRRDGKTRSFHVANVDGTTFGRWDRFAHRLPRLAHKILTRLMGTS